MRGNQDEEKEKRQVRAAVKGSSRGESGLDSIIGLTWLRSTEVYPVGNDAGDALGQ